MDFTIVTAVTPEYEKFLLLSLYNWKKHPQLTDKPLILYTHGYHRPEKKFQDLWKDIRIIKWDMEKYDTQRELMLSAFVIGVMQNVGTEYSLKLDSDVLVDENVPLLKESDFDYDIIGHRWGYTKPKSFILDIEEWAKKIELVGNPVFDKNALAEIKSQRMKRVGSRRFASFVCLQKTEFIRRCCLWLEESRLPIPSHDTFLWYMAERLPDTNWGARRFKPSAMTTSNFKKFQKFYNAKYNPLEEIVRVRSAKRKNRYPELFNQLAEVSKGKKMLSYGCGFEEPSSLLSACPETTIYATDINPKVIEQGIAMKKNITFFPTNKKNLEKYGKFDIILAMNIFKRIHLTPEELEKQYPLSKFNTQMEHLCQHLAPGGMLILSGTTYKFTDTSEFKENFEPAIESTSGRVCAYQKRM